MIRKLICGAGALGASMLTATAAWAAEAVETATETVTEAAAAVPVEAVEEAAAAVANPGNNAWMMTATILVLLMIVPGLALFYGGLTRSKNMLSTMTQIGATASLCVKTSWAVDRTGAYSNTSLLAVPKL
jgi:Amt family ammonium transporter